MTMRRLLIDVLVAVALGVGVACAATGGGWIVNGVAQGQGGDGGGGGGLALEWDPYWSAAASEVLSDAAAGQTAYGWGDHAQAGYLTAETDPGWTAWIGAHTPVETELDPAWAAWLLATPPVMTETDPEFGAWLAVTPPLYGETDPVWTEWIGAHTPLETETDPDFAAWLGGDPLAGFVAAETDPEWTAWLAATPPVMTEVDPAWTAWLLATPPVMTEADPGWAAWLGGFTTPGVLTVDAGGNFVADVNMAGDLAAVVGWGDHALAGYLTAETDPYALLRDQSTPQTITGGSPIFGGGLTIADSQGIVIGPTPGANITNHVGEIVSTGGVWVCTQEQLDGYINWRAAEIAGPLATSIANELAPTLATNVALQWSRYEVKTVYPDGSGSWDSQAWPVWRGDGARDIVIAAIDADLMGSGTAPALVVAWEDRATLAATPTAVDLGEDLPYTLAADHHLVLTTSTSAETDVVDAYVVRITWHYAP